LRDVQHYLLWDDDADRARAQLFPGGAIDDHGLNLFAGFIVNEARYAASTTVLESKLTRNAVGPAS
jgi:hypothetical protein